MEIQGAGEDADEDDRLGLDDIPDVPLEQILGYLDFEDLKDMRLVSKSYMKVTTRLVKKFHVWKIDPKRDENLLDDETFLEADTDINFRIPNSHEDTEDVLDNLCSWLQNCSHRISSFENVSCKAARKIMGFLTTYPRLISLDFSCCDFICEDVSGMLSLMLNCRSDLETVSFSLLNLDFLQRIDFDLPALQEVRVKDCRGSTGLTNLLTKSKSSLEYFRNEDFDELEFSSMPTHNSEDKFCRLKRIVMFSLDKMRVPEFRILLDNCSERLRTLVLKNACISTFGELANDFKVLREIRLELCCGLAGIYHLLMRSMSCLEVLQLSMFKNLVLTAVDQDQLYFPNITEVMISDTSRRIIAGLPGFLLACGPNLRSLHLNKVNLSNLVDLIKLKVAPSRGLGGVHKLQKIRIASCLGIQGLNCLLSTCSLSLRVLIIHRTDLSALKEREAEEDVSSGDQVADYVLPFLTTLSMYGCKGHAGLSNLVNKCAQNVKTLHLSRSEAVCGGNIMKMPQLEGLYLDRVEVPSIADLVQSCCQNLQVLGLRNVFYVNFDQLKPELPNLKIFSIYPKPGNTQVSKLRAWLPDEVEIDYDEDSGDRWIELYFSFDHGDRALSAGEFLWSATINM